MKIKANTSDQYADRYAEIIGDEEKSSFSLYHKLVAPQVLQYVGDVTGLSVLDAGCGEGRIPRELCKKGGNVTGIDISPKLIEYARNRSNGLDIDYKVADLSGPLPEEFKGKYDLVVSNLVIDDVPEYEGFISNLAWLTKPNGRVVLSKNNPYSALRRGKVDNYFESGKAVLYQGLSSAGVKVYYFHRTLEDYISEFAKAGFCLSRLSDLKPNQDLMGIGPKEEQERYRKYFRFPFLMVLEFVKYLPRN